MKIQILKQSGIACFFLLSGCAMTDLRVGENSRVGWISSVYTEEKLRTSPPTCLRALTPAQIASGRYVEIKVPHGRRGEYLPAMVPPSVQVHLRDEVEFSPKLCEAGVVPEVKQVLSHHK